MSDSHNHILNDEIEYGICVECGRHGSKDQFCDAVYWCIDCDTYHRNSYHCDNVDDSVWNKDTQRWE